MRGKRTFWVCLILFFVLLLLAVFFTQIFSIPTGNVVLGSDSKSTDSEASCIQDCLNSYCSKYKSEKIFTLCEKRFLATCESKCGETSFGIVNASSPSVNGTSCAPLPCDLYCDDYEKDKLGCPICECAESVSGEIPETNVTPERNISIICESSCDGKECGGDGCGGFCGICDENFFCEENVCVKSSSEELFTPFSNESGESESGSLSNSDEIGADPSSDFFSKVKCRFLSLFTRQVYGSCLEGSSSVSSATLGESEESFFYPSCDDDSCTIESNDFSLEIEKNNGVNSKLEIYFYDSGESFSFFVDSSYGTSGGDPAWFSEQVSSSGAARHSYSVENEKISISTECFGSEGCNYLGWFGEDNYVIQELLISVNTLGELKLETGGDMNVPMGLFSSFFCESAGCPPPMRFQTRSYVDGSGDFLDVVGLFVPNNYYLEGSDIGASEISWSGGSSPNNIKGKYIGMDFESGISLLQTMKHMPQELSFTNEEISLIAKDYFPEFNLYFSDKSFLNAAKVYRNSIDIAPPPTLSDIAGKTFFVEGKSIDEFNLMSEGELQGSKELDYILPEELAQRGARGFVYRDNVWNCHCKLDPSQEGYDESCDPNELRNCEDFLGTGIEDVPRESDAEYWIRETGEETVVNVYENVMHWRTNYEDYELMNLEHAAGICSDVMYFGNNMRYTNWYATLYTADSTGEPRATRTSCSSCGVIGTDSYGSCPYPGEENEGYLLNTHDFSEFNCEWSESNAFENGAARCKVEDLSYTLFPSEQYKYMTTDSVYGNVEDRLRYLRCEQADYRELSPNIAVLEKIGNELMPLAGVVENGMIHLDVVGVVPVRTYLKLNLDEEDLGESNVDEYYGILCPGWNDGENPETRNVRDLLIGEGAYEIVTPDVLEEEYREMFEIVRDSYGLPIEVEQGSDHFLGVVDGFNILADVPNQGLVDSSKSYLGGCGDISGGVDCSDWEFYPVLDLINRERVVPMGVGFPHDYGREYSEDPDPYDMISSTILLGRSSLITLNEIGSENPSNPFVQDAYASNILETYYLTHAFSSSIESERISDISNENIHQLKVSYENGVEASVNRGDSFWTVGGRILPEYGFYIEDTLKADLLEYYESDGNIENWFVDSDIEENDAAYVFAKSTGRNNFGSVLVDSGAIAIRENVNGNDLEIYDITTPLGIEISLDDFGLEENCAVESYFDYVYSTASFNVEEGKLIINPSERVWKYIVNCGESRDEIILVDEGEANAKLVSAGDVYSDESKDFLKEIIREISGVEIPEDGDYDVEIHVGKTKELEGLISDGTVLFNPSLENYSVDGYSISSARKDGKTYIFLEGNPSPNFSENGIKYSAKSFAELLGVRWYMPGDLWTFYPHRETLSVEFLTPFPEQGVSVVEPAFSSRHLSGANIVGNEEDIEWYNNNKLVQRFETSHNEGTIHGISSGEHIFFGDSERINEAQLYVQKYFSEDSSKLSVSLGVNDNLNYSEGDLVHYGPESSASESVFDYTNAVASSVDEDKLVVQLAYQMTKNPRGVSSLSENVVPFVTADTSFWIDPEMKFREQEIAEGWKEISSNLGLYDYYYGAPLLIPIFTPDLISESLQFFSLNVEREKGFVAESYPQWGLDGFKNYLVAKLLWDPSLDVNLIVDEFCEDMFGDASEKMKEYFVELESVWENSTEDQRSELYLDGESMRKRTEQLELFSPEKILEMKSILDQSKEIVSGDELVRERIEFFEVYLDYLYEWSETHHSLKDLEEINFEDFEGSFDEESGNLMKVFERLKERPEFNRIDNLEGLLAPRMVENYSEYMNENLAFNSKILFSKSIDLVDYFSEKNEEKLEILGNVAEGAEIDNILEDSVDSEMLGMGIYSLLKKGEISNLVKNSSFDFSGGWNLGSGGAIGKYNGENVLMFDQNGYAFQRIFFNLSEEDSFFVSGKIFVEDFSGGDARVYVRFRQDDLWIDEQQYNFRYTSDYDEWLNVAYYLDGLEEIGLELSETEVWIFADVENIRDEETVYFDDLRFGVIKDSQLEELVKVSTSSIEGISSSTSSSGEGSYTGLRDRDESYCGDLICDLEESCSLCPEDCGVCDESFYCGEDFCGEEKVCGEDCLMNIAEKSSYLILTVLGVLILIALVSILILRKFRFSKRNVRDFRSFEAETLLSQGYESLQKRNFHRAREIYQRLKSLYVSEQIPKSYFSKIYDFYQKILKHSSN